MFWRHGGWALDVVECSAMFITWALPRWTLRELYPTDGRSSPYVEREEGQACCSEETEERVDPKEIHRAEIHGRGGSGGGGGVCVGGGRGVRTV